MDREILDKQTARGLAELRMQLAQMTSASRILERSAKDERERGYLAILNQGICRMLRVIGRLELGYYLAGEEAKADLSPANLGKLTRELGQRLAQLLEGAGVKLMVQSPEQMPAMVDKQLLEQLLLELVSNGAKAGSEVTLSLTQSGANAVFTISDNGPGIPPEQLPHLFSTGSVDGSDWRKSGSGVVIAQNIAALHGGTLVANSAPGQGLKVAVTIPLRAEEYLGPMNSPSLKWDGGGFDTALIGLSHLLPPAAFNLEQDRPE